MDLVKNWRLKNSVRNLEKEAKIPAAQLAKVVFE